MILSRLARRLLIPVLAIIVLACATVGIYGAIRLASVDAIETQASGLLWVTVSVAAVGCLIAMLLGIFYSRAQSRAIVEAFERAAPRGESGASLVKAPAAGASIDDVVTAMAESFGQIIAQAAKDKGQLLTVIASMNEGLVAVDQQQRILLANRAAEQLLGLSILAAQGQPLWEHVSVEGVAQAASEVMLTGRPKTLTAGPHNGLYMEIMVSRLPAATGMVIVAHDITEATRYQRLREEFVANVSHELRTPLSVIKGFVETLRDGAIDDKERAARYLETVANHAEQLTNLVNDILDLSRLESRSDGGKMDEIDVAAMLGQVRDLMQPAAERKRQTLTFDIPQDLPSVAGNAEYLARALGNLVENAIKYTREGGWIKVSAVVDDDRVVIAVEDNGIGISDEDLPRIFERFYRSDRSRSREMGGTGLGLSIVKHIVQGHGGTVEVSSRVGAGSRFVVKLPASNGRS